MSYQDSDGETILESEEELIQFLRYGAPDQPRCNECNAEAWDMLQLSIEAYPLQALIHFCTTCPGHEE